jgi:AraC-like DNA-binding protein
MDSHTEQSIQRVIESIHQNIGERITIEDMARTAMFSKFHFTRLFQRTTGISPGRFLSAVRLEKAKKLLLTTSLSVTEITHQVGYNSVGTFSTRFKKSVGLSPTAYRDLRGFTPGISVASRRHGMRTAVIHGRFVLPGRAEEAGPVFAGLFPDTIPQGTPVKCTVLDRPGPFRFESVPEGRWYLLAQCVRGGYEESLDDEPPTVGRHGPIEVRPGMITEPLELRLRPMRVLDPPVLMALTDARRTALRSAAS